MINAKCIVEAVAPSSGVARPVSEDHRGRFVLLTFCFFAGRAEFRQTRLGKMMKHRIIKLGGLLAGLFHHSVLHHFAIPVLAALGCGYPAPGLSESFLPPFILHFALNTSHFALNPPTQSTTVETLTVAAPTPKVGKSLSVFYGEDFQLYSYDDGPSARELQGQRSQPNQLFNQSR